MSVVVYASVRFSQTVESSVATPPLLVATNPSVETTPLQVATNPTMETTTTTTKETTT